MTPPTVLFALTKAGAVLWLDNGHLRFRAPAGAVDPVLHALAAACRTALVALLKAGALLPPDLAVWPSDERDAYEERAAIREYEGGLPRAVAEREAERDVRLAHLHDFISKNALVVDPLVENAVAGLGRRTARTGVP
jgi:hypothetical protein